jgi:hypothetical protein
LWKKINNFAVVNFKIFNMKKRVKNMRLKAGTIIIMLVLAFTGCDSSGGSGEDYSDVDIIGYWDSEVTFDGVNYKVYVHIPNETDYKFYIGGYLDDSGTYTRKGNSITLITDYNDKIVGKATLTSPNTARVVLNQNSEYPGTYNCTRRK